MSVAVERHGKGDAFLCFLPLCLVVVMVRQKSGYVCCSFLNDTIVKCEVGATSANRSFLGCQKGLADSVFCVCGSMSLAVFLQAFAGIFKNKFSTLKLNVARMHFDPEQACDRICVSTWGWVGGLEVTHHTH